MTTTILTDIAARFDLVRKTGKWVGPCPKCGGSKASDKFNIRDDGGFKCYSCDFKGDLITWLRDMDGLSCPDAHIEAGRSCRATSCPAADTCRLGNGQGPRHPKKTSHLAPPPAAKGKTLPVATPAEPQDVWRTWATTVADLAAKAISGQPAVLTWLASRGIDAAAVIRFGLGWLSKSVNIERAAIGLPPKADGKATLWVPAGLVIRVDYNGQLNRMKVRRPSWARDKFLPDLKYLATEGGGTAPLIIRPLAGESRGFVVVEAELDGFACAAAHPQVTVVALGTVNHPLPPELQAELAAAPVILLALDAEQGKVTGKPGAGPAAIIAWQLAYRRAKYWPTPAGKDPGEYVKEHQGNLHAWIEAGLVPPIKAASHERMHNPVESPQGGEGEETTPPSDYHILTMADGREIYVAQDRTTWLHLQAEGHLVFSELELARLKAALGDAKGKERLAMIDAAIAVKEAFPASYVRDGRSMEPKA